MFSLNEIFSSDETVRKDTDTFKVNIENLISEEAFKTLLFVERKRTERSAKPFMLMLLDVSYIFEAYNRDLINKVAMVLMLKKVTHAIVSVTRDIDIKGWHETKHTIGIIFTEISKEGNEIIDQKVNESLKESLPPEFVSNIKISTYWYPSESDKNGYQEIFYSDPKVKSIKHKISSASKRSVDIVGSLVGLLIFSPVFLFASFLIKVTSRGPVFFRQERVGKGGRIFRIYKFRTMHAKNNDTKHQEFMKQFIRGQSEGTTGKGGQKIFKMADDPRITKIGKFLRKTSLDEVPQFINVLIGNMSLVGPRPPIPYEVQEYDLWHKRRVLETKPGITGYWQVEGRSTTNFDSMVRMDIRYIEMQSLLFDLKVIAKTPVALFTAKGAY